MSPLTFAPLSGWVGGVLAFACPEALPAPVEPAEADPQPARVTPGREPGTLCDEPHVLGRSVHVYVDEATRLPTPIPEVIARALDTLA
jgi:hypothetical protein